MKDKKNIILVFCSIILILGVFIINLAVNKKDDNKLLTGYHYVEMDVKDYGTILLQLNADIAPITVTNFMNLVKDGFYDGLTFHRVVPGFMIQGGAGNDNSKSVETIKGEFEENGIENGLSHQRGVISMARKDNDYDSASSQFFIMLEDDSSIDGKYAAFGYVVSGMEVVDEIAKIQTGNNGLIEYGEDRPVIEKMFEINVGSTVNTYEDNK